MSLDIYGDCPNCGMKWSYTSYGRDGENTRYSHLIGVVDPEQDRVVRWKCPHCDTEFSR